MSIRFLCWLLGHDTYVCDEETCYDYGHLVCRRCSRWVGSGQ